MQIEEVYRKYQILPSLQRHMYTVAAVGHTLAQALKLEEIAQITSACLLHDMGNLIKFKLDFLPQLLEPQGYEYWASVKSSFVSRYGDDEHKATVLIAQEIGVSQRTIELIESVGFSRAEYCLTAGISEKICCYADQRVAPAGVLSLQERVESGKARHLANKGNTAADSVFLKQFAALKQIEADIFRRLSIQPHSITDQTIQPIVSSLKRYVLV